MMRIFLNVGTGVYIVRNYPQHLTIIMLSTLRQPGTSNGLEFTRSPALQERDMNKYFPWLARNETMDPYSHPFRFLGFRNGSK